MECLSQGMKSVSLCFNPNEGLAPPVRNEFTPVSLARFVPQSGTVYIPTADRGNQRPGVSPKQSLDQTSLPLSHAIGEISSSSCEVPKILLE
jgi:hypothetical protein